MERLQTISREEKKLSHERQKIQGEKEKEI
jgi:hypothetical protein